MAALRVSNALVCQGVELRCLPGDLPYPTVYATVYATVHVTVHVTVYATGANGLAFAVDRVVWRRVIDAAGCHGHAESQADAVALIRLVALML